jgi:hypothetical protein
MNYQAVKFYHKPDAACLPACLPQLKTISNKSRITEWNHFMNQQAFIAKKYITNGIIACLAASLGMDIASTRILSARYDIHGDGNYHVIIGLPVNSFNPLPEFLPENTFKLTIPASRYAKMLINEQKHPERTGFGERMEADEYTMIKMGIFTAFRWTLKTAIRAVLVPGSVLSTVYRSGWNGLFYRVEPTFILPRRNSMATTRPCSTMWLLIT